MKILDFLVCDDIRNEIGNKHSIMGLYDSSIEFQVTPENKNKWPKQLKICFFIRIFFEEQDEDQGFDSFTFTNKFGEHSSILAEGSFSPTQISKSKKMILTIFSNSFTFDEAGEMGFIFEVHSKRSGETIKKDIEYLLTIKETVLK